MNYRGATAIAIAIVMGIAGLSLVGCPDNTGGGTGADTTAPGQVTGARASASTNSVTLSWTNPADADLAYIRITWTPKTSGPMQPIETARAATVATTQIIAGLDSGTPHTFTLIAVDASGNPSDSSGAATVTATTGVLGFTAIEAGLQHTCALRDGTVSCWGARVSGRLGIGGSMVGVQATPVAVSLTDVSAISIGNSHTCAIAGDNDGAYCWGDGSDGRLGNGATTGDQASPVAVLSGVAGTGINLTDVSAIAAGDRHTCAIAGDNDGAYCWGDGSDGRLGNGATSGNQPSPVAVMGPIGTTALTDVTAIVAGAQHTCAIANDTPYCWGAGTNGRLGSNTTADQSRPVLVVAVDETGTPPTSGADSRMPLAAVTSLSIDGDTTLSSPRSCAVAGTTAYCWGTGGDALGIGASAADQIRPAAVQGVGASGMPSGMPNGMLSGIVAIAAGAEHTCAVSPDAAYCWGSDPFGQLGNGTPLTVSSSSPVDITSFFP